MNNTGFNSYDDEQLISLSGFLFVAEVRGCWKDGKYFEKKDFTTEMISALAVHHGDNVKQRLENLGG